MHDHSSTIEAGWFRFPAGAWEECFAAVKAGRPRVPRWAVDADLQYWDNERRLGRARPSGRALAVRWGWPRSSASDVLRAHDARTVTGQSPDSPRTVPGQSPDSPRTFGTGEAGESRNARTVLGRSPDGPRTVPGQSTDSPRTGGPKNKGGTVDTGTPKNEERRTKNEERRGDTQAPLLMVQPVDRPKPADLLCAAAEAVWHVWAVYHPRARKLTAPDRKSIIACIRNAAGCSGSVLVGNDAEAIAEAQATAERIVRWVHESDDRQAAWLREHRYTGIDAIFRQGKWSSRAELADEWVATRIDRSALEPAVIEQLDRAVPMWRQMPDSKVAAELDRIATIAAIPADVAAGLYEVDFGWESKPAGEIRLMVARLIGGG